MHLRRKIRKFLFVLAVVSSSRLYIEKWPLQTTSKDQRNLLNQANW